MAGSEWVQVVCTPRSGNGRAARVASSVAGPVRHRGQEPRVTTFRTAPELAAAGAAALLGGCMAVVDPYPARVYVPGPRVVVPGPPVVVAPGPWGWGHRGGWYRRGHR
jgi:hypothetical protein